MKLQGTVRAVCISPAKGTEKRPAEKGVFIRDHGIENDAHAGKWHRQVSLLSYDSVQEFNRSGAGVTDGDFGENLLVEGIDLKRLPVGPVLKAGTVTLRLTQIGKECHSGCAIRERTGDCIMPREGVFAEVLEGGEIRAGDIMTAQLPDPEIKEPEKEINEKELEQLEDFLSPAVSLDSQIIIKIDNTETVRELAPDGSEKLILSYLCEKPRVEIDGNDTASDRINGYLNDLDEEYYTGENHGLGNTLCPGYNKRLQRV